MKTALITGANKGIGFETVYQLAQKGCYVILACRDAESGQNALKKLYANGLLNAEVLQLDVTDQATIDAAVQEVLSKHPVLDILINNAGIRGNVPQPASAVPMSEIEKVFATNFFGLIRVTQAFLPLLQKSEAPRIVNVSSDLASLTGHSDPAWKYAAFKPSAYAPSKAALNAYTLMLANELKDTTFKVNAVNPGHTATDFNNFRGERPASEAAKVLVKYALLESDGPTGGFFGEDGSMDW